MEERDKKTELLVGLFLLIGLLLVSALILKFSSVLEVFKPTYTVTTLFTSGAGINDGTPVMLGGTRVGKVKDKPKLNATFDGVVIQLEVYNAVHIPTDAKFTIGTAGLLGDSFIEIKPSGKETTTFVQPGAVINGESSKLSSLQNTAENVARKLDTALDDISSAVKDLRVSLKKINEGALSDDAMKDLRGTFKHLNNVVTRIDEKTFGDETSKNLKDAIASFKSAADSLDQTMKKFDPTIQKVNGVVDKADKVMTSADSALKTIDKTAATLGDTARDLRKGNGLLPALIGDEQLKNEFKQLIANLKAHGVLFYKNDKIDSSKKDEEESPRRFRNRPSTGTKR